MYKKIERNCIHCGKTYLGNPNSKYCGYDCSHASRKRRITLICQECGKEFERQQWNSDAKFCIYNCKYKNDSSDIIEIECTNCHKIFKRKEYRANRNANGNSFCSKECADEFNKGSNHYEWKEDLYSSYKGTHNKIKNKVKSQSIKSKNIRARKLDISIDELERIEKEDQSKIDQGYRFCNSCKQWKLPNKTNHYCKECSKELNKKSYNYSKQRKYLLNKKFGITIEEYDNLLLDQHNRCYICHIHTSKLDKSLAVDHDHITGKVRGLLCGSCNRFLGRINDSIETANRLLEYLKKNK